MSFQIIKRDPVTFDVNKYIEDNEKLAYQNKLWNKILIERRLDKQEFVSTIKEIEEIKKLGSIPVTPVTVEELDDFIIKLNVNKSVLTGKIIPEIIITQIDRKTIFTLRIGATIFQFQNEKMKTLGFIERIEIFNMIGMMNFKYVLKEMQ